MKTRFRFPTAIVLWDDGTGKRPAYTRDLLSDNPSNDRVICFAFAEPVGEDRSGAKDPFDRADGFAGAAANHGLRLLPARVADREEFKAEIRGFLCEENLVAVNAGFTDREIWAVTKGEILAAGESQVEAVKYAVNWETRAIVAV
ncbi:MAG: hypothetical protein ABR915_08945 [Thermoguttaceae bacterium]|jgi:hypothetical protein